MKSLMAVTYTSWLMVGFTSFSVTSIGEDGARCCASCLLLCPRFVVLRFIILPLEVSVPGIPCFGQESAVLSSGTASEG